MVRTLHRFVSTIKGVRVLPARAGIVVRDLDRLHVGGKRGLTEIRIPPSPLDCSGIGARVSRTPEA